MYKGISQQKIIEQERKIKYCKLQVLPITNGTYPANTAKNDIADFSLIYAKLIKYFPLQQCNYYIYSLDKHKLSSF